jgi:hypothetical protein
LVTREESRYRALCIPHQQNVQDLLQDKPTCLWWKSVIELTHVLDILLLTEQDIQSPRTNTSIT